MSITPGVQKFIFFCCFFAAARLRLAMKSKGSSYPQPEGALGDAMLKGGSGELENGVFGKSWRTEMVAHKMTKL